MDFSSHDSVNPYAIPYDCPRCKDFRVLSKTRFFRRSDLVPCDVCGSMSDEEYADFRRKRWEQKQPPVTICELDLTDEELKTFKRLKAEHPHASKTTVLMWIEGARYDPSKDEEFLTEAREEFRKWRAR